jgi:Zn-finger protein
MRVRMLNAMERVLPCLRYTEIFTKEKCIFCFSRNYFVGLKAFSKWKVVV